MIADSGAGVSQAVMCLAFFVAGAQLGKLIFIRDRIFSDYAYCLIAAFIAVYSFVRL